MIPTSCISNATQEEIARARPRHTLEGTGCRGDRLLDRARNISYLRDCAIEFVLVCQSEARTIEPDKRVMRSEDLGSLSPGARGDRKGTAAGLSQLTRGNDR